MNNLEYDNHIRNSKITLLCGVDEAGRGPLAGPVFAAAVILNPDRVPDGIDDSKKMSEKKREQLFDKIIDSAADFCIASASVEEIEKVNILQATYLAMTRAVNGLRTVPELVMVDGNGAPPEITAPVRTVIKGDALSATVAAASILAKVSRDRQLIELDSQYPQYQFAKHKGYGTRLHIDMIRQFGPSPVHRMSFLKKILETI